MSTEKNTPSKSEWERENGKRNETAVTNTASSKYNERKFLFIVEWNLFTASQNIAGSNCSTDIGRASASPIQAHGKWVKRIKKK